MGAKRFRPAHCPAEPDQFVNRSRIKMDDHRHREDDRPAGRPGVAHLHFLLRS